ncbi:MAG: poly-gamma-glutamate system protein [Polyangiaceae bacterium]
MKKLYWRPQRISLAVFFLLALLSACALAAVENFKVQERQVHYKTKMAAAQAALRAFKAIKAHRLTLGIPIDPETDPAETGMIGELITPVTTNTGHVPAKQTSVNPNFAAVVVDMLARAEVEKGDVVAVGMSGSFPALNIAVLTALEAMKVVPICIASAGSSQWGANHPSLTWPAMEALLAGQGIITTRSVAVSPGGVDDRAVGLSARGKAMLRDAVAAAGLTMLETKSYDESLDRRMEIYQEHAGDREIRAYINVGGGTTSVGTRVGKHMFKPGLNKTAPRGPAVDSVMTRFAERGVPVIHLTQIEDLAERYGLAVAPTSMPPVGSGEIFVRKVYSRVLATICLLIIVGVAVGMLRFDLGYRLLPRAGTRPAARPEPMV